MFQYRPKQIYNLEQVMLSQEIPIPVYFSKYDEQLNGIIEDLSKFKDEDEVEEITKGGKRDSAVSEIFNSISANGYQVSEIRTNNTEYQNITTFHPFIQVHVSGAHHTPNKFSKIPIVQGELFPILKAKTASAEAANINAKLPLIIITAHLDTFGLINVRRKTNSVKTPGSL